MTEPDAASSMFNERELEILRRIAEGQSNREIAADLHISLNTVRWYNKGIYDKLDTHSRTAAIARARALGLLEPEADSAAPLDPPALTNLPAQLTPFIGRERETAELQCLLDNPDIRLVTILGPGGIGKSRLAHRLAHENLQAFRHGVFWIALAPVQANPDNAYESVVTTIANTLHITLRVGIEPETSILNYLRDREMLLAIDNFEHLLGGAQFLSRILEAAPSVKILSTSREALGVYGEAVYLLTGMAVPERELSPEVEAYDAVKLFLQTARRVHRDYDPDEAELSEITRICKLVEGLPLGIELAAAWVRSLSVYEIREQLEQGLDILETRSQNIRHVFDRSWHLLSQAEQIAFARLSVFRGSFTRDAIEAVTGARLRMITSLVDKSLLWRLPDGTYAMHELLRQYATEKLDLLPDQSALLARHCDYYAAYAGQWGRALNNQQQIEGLEALEKAYQNVHAAWDFATRHRREKAVKELLEMWYFFDIRSRWREGLELFNAASESVEGLTRARLMTRQAMFTFRLGIEDVTRALIEQSLSIFQTVGNERETALAKQVLGNVMFYSGELETAEKLWLEAIAIGERHNDMYIVDASLVNVGLYRENVGDLAGARA